MASGSADAPAQHEPDSNGLEGGKLTKEPPPFFSKIHYATRVYGLQTFVNQALWFRGWKEYFYPPNDAPNIVKTYECRPHLPVR
jgi:hypothetical protein